MNPFLHFFLGVVLVFPFVWSAAVTWDKDSKAASAVFLIVALMCMFITNG